MVCFNLPTQTIYSSLNTKIHEFEIIQKLEYILLIKSNLNWRNWIVINLDLDTQVIVLDSLVLVGEIGSIGFDQLLVGGWVVLLALPLGPILVRTMLSIVVVVPFFEQHLIVKLSACARNREFSSLVSELAQISVNRWLDRGERRWLLKRSCAWKFGPVIWIEERNVSQLGVLGFRKIVVSWRLSAFVVFCWACSPNRF